MLAMVPYRWTLFPQVRSLYLRLLGARISAGTIIQDVRFFNLYRFGLPALLYGLAQLLRRDRQDIPTLFDAHNAVWTIFRQMARHALPGPRKWALDLEWRKLKRYEGEIGRRFDAVTAVSEEQFDWRIVCRKLDEVYAGVGR